MIRLLAQLVLVLAIAVSGFDAPAQERGAGMRSMPDSAVRGEISEEAEGGSVRPSAVVKIVEWWFSPFGDDISPIYKIFLLMLGVMFLGNRGLAWLHFHSLHRLSSSGGMLAAGEACWALLIVASLTAWFKVWQPVALVHDHLALCQTVVLGHFAVGIVVALLRGAWDLYFKYYLPKRNALQDLYRDCKEVVISKLAADQDPGSAEVRLKVRQKFESSPLREEIIGEPLKARDHAGRYVFIGLFWEPYVLWTFCLQYVISWAKLIGDLGQIVANRARKSLFSVGLED